MSVVVLCAVCTGSCKTNEEAVAASEPRAVSPSKIRLVTYQMVVIYL